MEYLEFERILSAKRMQRYKDAANGDDWIDKVYTHIPN